MWYGKGPGVDRAMDSLRHANMYGVNANGGYFLLVGDDPASKSSTVPAVSERTLAALNIPVLFPRNASEIVRLGMQGIAMSRASGCIVALKIVADVADGAWVVDESASQVRTDVPEVQWARPSLRVPPTPDGGCLPPDPACREELFGPRSLVVKGFAALNELNEIEVQSDDDTVGILASGTAFDSLRQALIDLGLDDNDLRKAGIRLLRLGMMTPVEPGIVRQFAAGLRTVLVVEDKTAFIEDQIRTILYGRAGAPAVLGKADADGKVLVPSGGELAAGRLHAPLRRMLSPLAELAPPAPVRIDLPILPTERAPYFCCGCPHNRSTAIPEGSLAGGGIGCHIMVTTSGRQDSEVVGLTQMGGEGAQWIGQSGFSDVDHLFQNLGDGTFFHSGQLAIQACVAAGVDITYKRLYNDVVAMTGAQDAEGALTVEEVTKKLHAERVARIIVCTEEPRRYRGRRLSPGTEVWHRDRLDEAQRALRDTAGVTVLIYDQHCAADARRRRKRGQLEARPTRVVINEAVCEGCGSAG